MKKIIFAMTVLAIAMMAGVTMGADMIAGNPKNGANVVGTVDVSDDGTNLTVVYTITNLDYIITAIHVEVATSPDLIPQSKGNAVPGHFTYSASYETSVQQQSVTLIIPLADIFDPDPVPAPLPVLYVAAHAVVGTGIGDCSELALPSDVLMRVLYANPTIPEQAYFEEVTIQFPCPDVIPEPTTIDGTYYGWCLDPDTNISNDLRYLGIPYSSLLPLPTSLTDLWETPENLPMVIWLMNNTDLIGTASICGGDFTYGDFQNAMWGLLEDGDIFEPGDLGTYVLGEFTVCRTLELMDLAAAHSDFVPGCGDYIGVILDTYYVGPCPDLAGTPSQRQPVLIPFPCECDYSSMTAWAGTPVTPSKDWPDEDNDGYKYEFPGKDWSMYITYPEDAVVVAVSSAANGKKK